MREYLIVNNALGTFILLEIIFEEFFPRNLFNVTGYCDKPRALSRANFCSRN